MQPSENNLKVEDVVIIGGGPAGVTAALYCARAGLKTLVIDKGLTAGALGLAGHIANYPGVNGKTSGAELLETMRGQAREAGAQFISDKVIGTGLKEEIKIIYGNSGAYLGRSVIIASGSMGRSRLVKGENELLGRGVSYCATCDGAFFKDQEVLVAGSSDEAIEEALYLTRLVKKVHFLCPFKELKAPAELAQELLQHRKVTYYADALLKEICGGESVKAARFTYKDGGDEELAVSAAFLYLQGGKPITDFLQGQLELSPNGCILVDNELQTALPGIFAAGDVLCNHIKQVVIAAGEGARAAMAAEKALRGRKQILVDWVK